MGQSIQEWTNKNLWKIAFKKLEGLLKQTISLQIFKGSLPQILHGPFLNTLSQMILKHGHTFWYLSNHRWNIQTLLIEIFKTKNGLAPPLIGIDVWKNTTYNLRNFHKFETKKKNWIFWFRNKLLFSTILVTPARTHDLNYLLRPI